MGALSEFTEKRFGRPVRYNPVPLTTTVATSATHLWRANPDRLELVLMNLSAYNMSIFTDASVSASKGWLLAANGGHVVFTAEEDADLVGFAWYAVATTQGTIFTAEIEGV